MAEFVLVYHTSDMARTIAKVLFITKPEFVLQQVVEVHHRECLKVLHAYRYVLRMPRLDSPA